MPQGPSQAFHGYGTVLYRSNGASPAVWTAVAEVKSIKPPGFTTESFDISHLTSPDAVREKLAGMRDSSEVTFQTNYLPQNATHQTLLADSQSRATIDWKIVLSDVDESEWTFPAFVSRAEPGAIGIDGAALMDFALMCTSAPTPPA